MKKLAYITTIFALLTSFNSWSQCGANIVQPTPNAMGLCEGIIDTVFFAAGGDCSGIYEFQVTDTLGNVVQPWSSTAEYIATGPPTNTFLLSARCDLCPSVVVTDTFIVEFIPQPSAIGDTLICFGNTATLTAVGTNPPGSISWWDAPQGGTEVSSTEIFTTPPMTQNTTYYMHASGTITGGGGSGSILITECGLHGFPGSSSADYIEVSNLYTTAVNTSGWVVAVSSSYSNINSVNSTYWNLPNSFTPCSNLNKSDVSGQSNYWGNNILWNPGSNSWAIIIDDLGNVVDFCAWGWTAAEIAGFNTMINGFNITLGPEWTGGGCSSACSPVGGTPYSLSRTGNNDNNVAGDFTCQATSLNTVNPGLSCGWTTQTMTCPYPVNIVVDSLPSASNPATINVSCITDVPPADPAVVLDETDDYSVPVVTFESEVSDGMTCPETITRTYRVADSCNFIDVTQTIIVNDLDAPIMDPAPADVNVSCIADVPPIIGLNWTDNCLGSGTVMGVDVSDGQSCPETITRTWTISDDCGNITTEAQIITVHDLIVPDMDPAPADVFVQCYSNVPTMLPLNWSDNCDGNGQVNGVEVSDGNSCPEVLTRTWSYTDGCGNNVMRTQTVVIHDTTAPTASPLLAEQVITLPAPDITLLADASDNCGTPVVAFVGDSSNGGFCPEIVIRTYSVTDQCGNVTLITQNFAVGDPFPEASFIASPTLLTNLMEGTVNFTNTTTGAVTYEWDFDDGSATTNEISPTHDFYNDETAGYVVQLVATSPYGCTDTFTVVVQVREELLYFIPNSFTPDDDEFNQTFQPVFESGFDPYDFNMLIFNRWGEVVFETNDASSYGWDGTFNGYKVEAGTYIWRIEFGDEYTDERTIITGHVNLIR